MTDLVFHNSTSNKTYNSQLFENILNTAIRILNLRKKNLSLSINLVSESGIKKLNHKYRDKNKSTDVLSFPLQPERLQRPEGAKRLEGPFDIGDIFICLPIAKKYAKRENISIERKLARLTVHGFLHLLGYDHEKSKKESDKMFKLENKILKNG